ncbi:laminin subunit gamma-1-like isoform X1 [Dermacentor albipictus]|uniref:laminin subunit gamma-1-like isoform X1 n=1 Tax=Dermacentor albipictus TaxID=60249 RepID=UPI0031FDE5DB
MKFFLLHLAFFFFVASSPNVSASNFDGRYYNQQPRKGSRSWSGPDCATCECANGERRCANPYDKCECIQGFLYYKDTDGCPRHARECNTPDWHKHFANNSGCLLCECSRSRCTVGTKCHCRDGVVYPEDDPVNCVGSRQDCFRRRRREDNFWKMKDANQRCAGCDCPNGKQECTGYHAKCDCFEGTLYYKNSSWCAQYEEECDLPDWHKHFANNSECLLCECSQTSCAVGTNCHCSDGVVYRTNNPIKCVKSRLECFRRPRKKRYIRKNKASSGGCANCECPNGEQECTGYKAKCDCVDGILYYKDSSWCAKYEEDCDRPDWHKHFANNSDCLLCDCDKPSCNVGPLCHCEDGIVYLKESGMECVRIRKDCFRKHQKKSRF